jgi:hypothetical protein
VATMSDLVQVQHCVSAEPWFELTIGSHSHPDVEYRVKVAWPDDTMDELICECESYLYRGRCRHQQEAFAILCRWHQLEGPETQTVEQLKNRICPRCGDETIRVSEYDD